jgi:hypothetical protein
MSAGEIVRLDVDHAVLKVIETQSDLCGWESGTEFATTS